MGFNTAKEDNLRYIWKSDGQNLLKQLLGFGGF